VSRKGIQVPNPDRSLGKRFLGDLGGVICFSYLTTRVCASIILILIGLVSCNSPDKTSSQRTVSDSIQNIPLDTVKESLPINRETQKLPTESIPNFTVDDYPITNKMLEPKAHYRVSGEISDGEGSWFSNDTLNQTLVFVLYTDYHRLVTYHFLNSDIPAGIIKRMELHITKKDGGLGDLATDKQKQKYFKGFLTQTKKISKSYFTTSKGFKLGDSKEKMIEVYGKPDKSGMENGIEKCEWNFIGDTFYNDTIDLKGKPLAKNSFGHQTIMFFRDNKLIGLILHNDIP
jgi:hypothetical protein